MGTIVELDQMEEQNMQRNGYTYYIHIMIICIVFLINHQV